MKTWKVYEVEGYAPGLELNLNMMEAEGWAVFSIHPVDLRGYKDLLPAWNVILHKEERPKPTRPPFFCGDELIVRGVQQSTTVRVVGVNGGLDGVVHSYILENSDGVRTPPKEAALVHSMWVLAPKETR